MIRAATSTAEADAANGPASSFSAPATDGFSSVLTQLMSVGALGATTVNDDTAPGGGAGGAGGTVTPSDNANPVGGAGDANTVSDATGGGATAPFPLGSPGPEPVGPSPSPQPATDTAASTTSMVPTPAGSPGPSATPSPAPPAGTVVTLPGGTQIAVTAGAPTSEPRRRQRLTATHLLSRSRGAAIALDRRGHAGGTGRPIRAGNRARRATPARAVLHHASRRHRPIG